MCILLYFFNQGTLFPCVANPLDLQWIASPSSLFKGELSFESNQETGCGSCFQLRRNYSFGRSYLTLAAWLSFNKRVYVPTASRSWAFLQSFEPSTDSEKNLVW